MYFSYWEYRHHPCFLCILCGFMFKSSSERPGNCKCTEINMGDCYSCILPDSSLKSTKNAEKSIKLSVFGTLNHVEQNGENITSEDIILANNIDVNKNIDKMGRVKRIWYLPLMRAAKVQASLRIHAVSPEPSLLAHTSSESSGTFRQKARSLAPLNGWACTVKICHDAMLKDTNLLDAAQMIIPGHNILTLNVM